jgi:hypothetical protein
MVAPPPPLPNIPLVNDAAVPATTGNNKKQTWIEEY